MFSEDVSMNPAAPATSRAATIPLAADSKKIEIGGSSKLEDNYMQKSAVTHESSQDSHSPKWAPKNQDRENTPFSRNSTAT
jgi:hypothetical protein